MDRWSPDFLALLHDLKEVDLETTAGDGRTSHRATIWVVVDEGEVFIRSWKGERGRWYREIRERPEAVLHAAGQSVSVRREPAVDPESVRRVSDAARRLKAGGRAGDLLPFDRVPVAQRIRAAVF